MAKLLTMKAVLVQDSKYFLTATSKLKKRLLEVGLLTYKCSKCGLEPEWQGIPLTLQLDHINGLRNDHRISNLRILCPNCHSQTKTYAGRNKKISGVGRKFYQCCDCSRTITAGATRCKRCSGIKQFAINWPEDNEFIARVEQATYAQVARDVGVSANSVRIRYLLLRSGRT